MRKPLRVALTTGVLAPILIIASACAGQSTNAGLIAGYKAGKCSLLKTPNTDDPTVNAWNDLCTARQLGGCKTAEFIRQDEQLARARQIAATAEDAASNVGNLAAAGRDVLDADNTLASHNDQNPACTSEAAALYVVEHRATDTLDDAGYDLLQANSFQDVLDRAQGELSDGIALLDEAQTRLSAIENAMQQAKAQRGLEAPATAAAFFKRRLADGYEAHYARIWESLDPVDKRLTTRSAFLRCWGEYPANEVLWVRITKVNTNVGYFPDRPTLTYQVWAKIRYRGTKTGKLYTTPYEEMPIRLVNGSWHWMFDDNELAAEKRGVCPKNTY